MDYNDIYRPCPCGSGKKYKFCCLQKQREQDDNRLLMNVNPGDLPAKFDAERFDGIVVGDLDESRRLCDKGLRLMSTGQFKRAIPWFRKSIAEAPAVYTPANNLALCLFIIGEIDGAIQVQRQSLDESPLPNPFGLASHSTFHYFNGDEARAKRTINQVMKLEMPSADATLKVCETLSRFNRHKDILKVVDNSEFSTHPAVRFFSGVAAANLGDFARARDDLRQVQIGHPKVDMARRYLEDLSRDRAPHTVRGNWPYLMLPEVCPQDIIKHQMKLDPEQWGKRRIVVDVCEAFLNNDVDSAETIVKMLDFAKHPDAVKLLWTIVRGTFGTDALRMQALHLLTKRGEVSSKDKIEIDFKGEKTTIQSRGLFLNEDHQFADPLPPLLEKRYAKAIEAGRKRAPNWTVIANEYLHILQKQPNFFPARYNYAVSLVHSRRIDEAEGILRELVEAHPEYLFAHATLLQILMTDRMAEAEALHQSMTLPKETHPDAMVSWLISETIFFRLKGDLDAAAKCFGMAQDIAPNNRQVKAMQQNFAFR